MSNLPVVYQYRCKICQMAKTHPDLFKELHQQVLEINNSMSRAMNYINDKIANEGIDAPKLNNQNMSVHFNSHITIPERMNAELAKVTSSNPALKDVNHEVGSYVEDIVRRKVGNEVNDYLNLDRLRAMLMDKLEFLDEITAVTDSSSAKSMDLDSLQYYINLVKEIRSCIVDINKIRHSKQLVSLVIKSLIEKNTFDIVRQMAREYDQVKKDMLESGVDSAIVDKIYAQLGMRLAEVVAVTARNAVSDVIKTYKLD